MTSSGGVLTTFKLGRDALEAAFGSTLKATVATYNRPRSFAKSFKTGSTDLVFASADGKYSKGTSTLTLKFEVRAGGGCYGYGDSDDGCGSG